MVAYCNDCKRYVNPYCERCGGNFGIDVCERFGCGGRMTCPHCGGHNLTKHPDTARPALIGAEGGAKPALPQNLHITDTSCPLCGFPVKSSWNYCPDCGIPLKKAR